MSKYYFSEKVGDSLILLNLEHVSRLKVSK